MKDFLLTEDFKRYRKKQLEVIANHVTAMLWNAKGKDFKEIRGALDIARKIIQLPMEIVDGKEEKESMYVIIQSDIKEFETRFIRAHLFDE